MVKKSAGDAGILGLGEVTRQAMQPIAHMDPEMGHEDIAWKVAGYIGKVGAKYWSKEDERTTKRGTLVEAQVVIEEFVDAAMQAISGGLGEKPWFGEANFTDPLTHASIVCFEKAKFLCRVTKPMLRRTVDTCIARFREEERIQKVLWEAVVISGLPDSSQKGAWKHLQNSYDSSHLSAEFGVCKAEPAELGYVQDFVKYWMTDFARRASDVLYNSVGEQQDQQYAFLTTLFQHLTEPEQCCLPHDLVSQPGAAPPENWAFVAETAMAILKCPGGEEADDDEDGNPRKKAKGGKGGR